jgi:NADPH:quinone reductase-like Zn-dependent oxidoreductase
LGAADGAVRHDGAWIEKLQASPLFNGSVHVVLDPVASSYAEQNLAALAIDGRWVLYSALSGPGLPEAVGKTYFGSMARKRLSLLATTLRTRTCRRTERGERRVHVSLVHPGGDLVLLLFLLPEVQ